MKTLSLKVLCASMALALAACSTVPTTTPTLDAARAAYAEANSANVAQYAPLEFKNAGDALEQANQAAARKEALADIDQLAYLAKQKIETAREVARTKMAEAQTDVAARQRDQLQLAARTAEADRAKAAAAAAQGQVQAAQDQAAAARDAAAQAQAQAAASAQAARDAQQRLAEYQAVLVELHAVQTPRGMVVTISDVLFDTDQASLHPEGVENLHKLARVLQLQPQRKVMVEGYTDSTGSAQHNQELSERRAAAVRDTLTGLGVDPARISMRGYGERFPVAANDSAAHRQLNRRVEIVLSNDAAAIPPR